jgi:hypothetical protein
LAVSLDGGRRASPILVIHLATDDAAGGTSGEPADDETGHSADGVAECATSRSADGSSLALLGFAGGNEKSE